MGRLMAGLPIRIQGSVGGSYAGGAHSLQEMLERRQNAMEEPRTEPLVLRLGESCLLASSGPRLRRAGRTRRCALSALSGSR